MAPSTSAPDPADHTVVPLRARGVPDITRAVVDLDDLNSPHTLAVLSVPPDATVLDVGCGPGVVARALSARGCQVWGLEIDARKAALARPHCVEVVEADVESGSLATMFAGRRFDAILCLDVLEHLRTPDTVLGELAALLAPGGRILISVPNVTHGALRLELLRGRFGYRPSGLLDRGHLRFFDGDALRDLIRGAGLRADTTLRVVKRLDQTEFDVDLDSVPEAVRHQLERDPDALTYQYFVVARPSHEGQGDGLSLVERMRTRVDEVVAELEKAGAYARHVEAELKAKDEELTRRALHATHVAQLEAELEKAAGRTRALEAALEANVQQLGVAATQASELAHVRAELERAGVTSRLLETELAVKVADLQTRDVEVERLSSALARAEVHGAQLGEALAASLSRADALDETVAEVRRQLEVSGARVVECEQALAASLSVADTLGETVTELRGDLEASRARALELDSLVVGLRRLSDDSTSYVRHLEQELLRRAGEIAIRDDGLSVAGAHIEKTERVLGDHVSQLAQVEAYVRRLEGELESRAHQLAARDGELAGLRTHVDTAEGALVEVRGALAAHQALAASLSQALQLPRHRFATAWGNTLIDRAPWLHRLLRPLAVGVARRWCGPLDPQ
jgi:2-polyprenyl-3-methyl-5-hydroxy-6-metoxy-1,4-benzoquinol methylase